MLWVLRDHLKLVGTKYGCGNPFQSILVLRIVDKTGFTPQDMQLLTSKEMLTMKDILNSKNIPEEYIDYLLIFLNKYPGFAIEQNKEFWIKRLN